MTGYTQAHNYCCDDKSSGVIFPKRAFFKSAFPSSAADVLLLPFYQQQEV